MRFYGLTEERSKEMSGLKNLGPLQPIGVLLGYTGPPEVRKWTHTLGNCHQSVEI